MKKSSIVLLLLVGASILGATVLREPVAWAAQNLNVTIWGAARRRRQCGGA